MSTAQPAPTPSTPSESSSSPEPSDEERERIVRQLEQLERKQAELRRALIVADHPTLAGPIREVDGRVYGVQLASDRLDAPLSKSEQKKLERLAKKIGTLRAKREELDRYLAVSREDIQRVAGQYFAPTNRTVLDVVPATDAEGGEG